MKIIYLFELNYEGKMMNQTMDKIVLSKFDAKKQPIQGTTEIVQLLLKEGLSLEDINKNAVISYSINRDTHNNIFYSEEENILFKNILEGYKTIKAWKHLEYIQKQKEENLRFIPDMKELAKEEGYEEVHNKIISFLEESEIISYRKMLTYFACIIGEERIGLSQEELLSYPYFINTSSILDGLKKTKAVKHLKYAKKIIKKSKSFLSKPNKLSKEEDINKLHINWLLSLECLEIDSFKNKYKYLSTIIGKELMDVKNVSSETLRAYRFLTKWDKKRDVFDLESIYSVETYREIEKYHWKKYFSDSDTDRFDYEFYSFAVDGGGGHYLLWNYEDLKKEPPVVYLSSEGESKFLASTFAEYLIKLPNYINEDTIDDVIDFVEYEVGIDSFLDDYYEKTGKKISEKKFKKLLEKDVNKYINKVNKKFTYNDEMFIEEKKKFKDFIKVMDEYSKPS